MNFNTVDEMSKRCWETQDELDFINNTLVKSLDALEGYLKAWPKRAVWGRIDRYSAYNTAAHRLHQIRSARK